MTFSRVEKGRKGQTPAAHPGEVYGEKQQASRMRRLQEEGKKHLPDDLFEGIENLFEE